MGQLGGPWIPVSRSFFTRATLKSLLQSQAALLKTRWADNVMSVVEPPYNALAFRLGEPMPNTEKLVLQQRPAAIGEAVPLFIGWETLTNAENPF